MSIRKPYFKLYDSGNNLIYTFPLVQATNAPQTPRKSVVIESQRGKGAIILDGGEEIWELYIKGLF